MRLFGLLLFVFFASLQLTLSLELQVIEGPEYRIAADTIYPLTVKLIHNSSDLSDVGGILQDIRDKDSIVMVTPHTEFQWQLDFENSSLSFDYEDLLRGANKSFLFSSYYWGYVPLSLRGSVGSANSQDSAEEDPPEQASGLDTSPIFFNNKTLIIVDRKASSKIMDLVFMVTATAFMLVNTVNMGCQLDLVIIRDVMKKPIGPAVGIVSQFVCMPMFAFFTGWLLLDDPLQRLGLFTLGCSPGGSASNFWTLLFDGDLNLSITMTFVSTVIAMGMMPFWMLTLGSKLLGEDSNITIPYLNLASSLLALTVPVAIGLLIKYKKKNWAKMSEKIVKPMTFCMLTFFLTVGIYNNYKSLTLMTWHIVAAGFMVAIGGYCAGAFLSLAFCLNRKQIIAISIETAFQNAAIAFLLLKLSLPTPDSDLAAVPVLAQLFQTGPPLLTLYLVWQCLQKAGFCKFNRAEQEDKEKDVEECESLNETPTEEEEVPRTPGLLYDPSMPDDFRQK